MYFRCSLSYILSIVKAPKIYLKQNFKISSNEHSSCQKFQIKLVLNWVAKVHYIFILYCLLDLRMWFVAKILFFFFFLKVCLWQTSKRRSYSFRQSEYPFRSYSAILNESYLQSRHNKWKSYGRVWYYKRLEVSVIHLIHLILKSWLYL